MNDETFIYCSVLPVGFSTTYYYLSFTGDLTIGTRVQVPFGAENKLIPGTVTNCETFSAENVPFPIEKMKCIVRILSEEDFEKLSKELKLKPAPKVKVTYHVPEYDPDVADELDEVDELIEAEDYDGIFSWADEHHDRVESPQILQKVLECYELCVEQNMPQAALNLGTMYYNGRVVMQDFKKAAHYYKIAADAGISTALCNLGYCFYYGRHQDVDYEKAYDYFLKGALLHNNINCLYKLGDMYLNGYGVERNETYAFMLYSRAWRSCEEENKKFGVLYCTPDIQFRMGKCFLQGIGTPVNALLALDFLTQALCGFYRRRKTDPFVQSLIDGARELIESAQEILDEE